MKRLHTAVKMPPMLVLNGTSGGCWRCVYLSALSLLFFVLNSVCFVLHAHTRIHTNTHTHTLSLSLSLSRSLSCSQTHAPFLLGIGHLRRAQRLEHLFVHLLVVDTEPRLGQRGELAQARTHHTASRIVRRGAQSERERGAEGVLLDDEVRAGGGNRRR